jgi:hypothetical protein
MGKCRCDYGTGYPETSRELRRATNHSTKQHRRVGTDSPTPSHTCSPMQDVRRTSNGCHATNGYGVRSPFLFRVRLGNVRRGVYRTQFESDASYDMWWRIPDVPRATMPSCCTVCLNLMSRNLGSSVENTTMQCVCDDVVPRPFCQVAFMPGLFWLIQGVDLRTRFPPITTSRVVDTPALASSRKTHFCMPRMQV